MNPIRSIIVAATLSALSGYAQGAETVKPLQAVSFHTETKDAVAYFTADHGACKVALTITEKVAYAPARIEDIVAANKSMVHQLDDANALRFVCQADAQAMTLEMQTTVATK